MASTIGRDLGPYLLDVFRFTFRGSLQHTDRFQIVGGTAVPSIILGTIFQVLGLQVPLLTQAAYATYLGYGLLSWLALRLIAAPFFIWREQHTEIARLAEELARPERRIFDELAKLRAEKRLELFEVLDEAYSAGLREGEDRAGIARHINRAKIIAMQGGYTRRLVNVFVEFGQICGDRQAGNMAPGWLDDLQCLDELCAFLNGHLELEVLEANWPYKKRDR